MLKQKLNGFFRNSPSHPYFWPQYQANDTSVFAIPEYAIISRAAFARVPAVFKDKRVLGFYQTLVQTYLQPLTAPHDLT